MSIYQYPTDNQYFRYNIVLSEDDFKELNEKINWSKTTIVDIGQRKGLNIDNTLLVTTNDKYDWQKSSIKTKNFIQVFIISRAFIQQKLDNPENAKFKGPYTKLLSQSNFIKFNILNKVKFVNYLGRSFNR